ncbi:hypothetical protein M9458_051733 [Cirrhinus mrigala]|uniref:Gypsy retrotransposon integrase-like protein 1 n=1 Tax=Cirrhinus mrigala TaxID=683832 RepID=A0ABD0MTS5_CIRMR
MDPTPPDQSLTASQKTSPPSDPATAQASPSTDPTTVLQITSELSAQASTLLLHQQQLDRLTDLTGQLVRALQGLQLTPPPAPTPVTTPPPGAQSAAASPRLAFPENQQPHLSHFVRIGLRYLAPGSPHVPIFLRVHSTAEDGEAGEQLRGSLATCPTRLPRPPTSVSSFEITPNRCEIPVTLSSRNVTVEITALIDSGAAGNFIDADFITTNHLPVLSCAPHVAVAALDGRPLGSGKVLHTTDVITLRVEPSHQETIRLFVISSPQSPIILGYPWLNLHGPTIAWANRTITRWSLHCQEHCLQPRTRSETPLKDHTTKNAIPTVYQDLLEAFSHQKATQLPPHRPGDCAIDLLPGATPPRGRIFPLSQAESAAMDTYIQEELAKGFIRPSTSPASAGFFFVKKKDGGLRPCIDYRGRNEMTIEYRYPLPLVPSALEQLRTAKIFTKLDLRSAYNLIRIRAGDEWKTAFSTTSGHYEYRVMPFGLANSPSFFQAFINEVFRDMLHRWVIVYIDDILIYSNSYDEHVRHVRAVLQRLIKHQLYAKEEKCEFHLDKISFLGYVISSEGVAMDEKKVNAVLNWPRPTTLKELQRFLGFSNFYRRFIRQFSSVAAPLTAMVKKGASRLTWTQPALQAFNDLRLRFSTAPILHHPDPDKPFVVEVDASSTGVGAVLSQRQGDPPKLFPCAYFSHKLSSAEKNYDVGNRELLAIKLALEEWRHWLEGAKHPFTVLTDHKNLEYLRTAKLLNHRQARSAESVLPASMIVAPVTWDIMTEISEAQTQDPTPANCPKNLVYVPLTLRARVLAEVHATPSSGHPGIEATLHLLGNRFWWPTQRADTIEFVRRCSVCNITKVPRRLPAGLLQPLPVPQRLWSHIAVDFITDLPPSNGFTTILSVIDRFSKGCRLIPLSKLPTAMETAELLCNWVFRIFGLPEDIVSDRGPQFSSRLWSSFFRLLGVNVSLTLGYHPQANGQVERLNQELARFLCSYCHNRQEDWSRYLFWAEYAQNSSHPPPLFPWSGEPSELPAVNSWFQQSEETWNLAHIHLQRAIRRTQTQADRRRRPNPPYVPGQWVWLSTRDLRLRLPCKKLSPRYVGPFKIVKQITPVSFRLQLPADYRISPTFHVSLLKPAGDPEGVENLDETAPWGPPPTIIDGEEVYRVNTILDSRRRRGHLQYLVDWEGFGPEERSWVAAGDILDPSLTTDFHSTHYTPPWEGSLGGGGVGLCHQRAGTITGLLTHYISHHPVPGIPTSGSGSSGSLPLWRPFIDRQFWLARTINPERFSPLFCLIVADWTVYSSCMIYCRLPRPFAWTIVYSLDYLRHPRLLLIELCLLYSSLLIKPSQMDPTPPDQSLTASQISLVEGSPKNDQTPSIVPLELD